MQHGVAIVEGLSRRRLLQPDHHRTEPKAPAQDRTLCLADLRPSLVQVNFERWTLNFTKAGRLNRPELSTAVN